MGEEEDRVILEPERDELGLPLGELRGESPIHCIMAWKGALPEFFFLFPASGSRKDPPSSSWPLDERERRSRPPMTEENSPAGAEAERSRAAGVFSDWVGHNSLEGQEKDRSESGGLPSDSQLNSSLSSSLGLRMT